MKNDSVKKIVSLVVLIVLCAATVAGAYLGLFGRNVSYVDVPGENGNETLALERQVAFIPNTFNQTWREAIRPDASLNGGYGYTLTFDNADQNALNAAAQVLVRRAELLAGSAAAQVNDGSVTLAVAESAFNTTLASALTPMGTYDFALYNAENGTIGDAVMTSEHVKQTYYANSNGSYTIQVQLNSKGEKAVQELSAQNPGGTLYLRLDGSPIAYGYLSALTNGVLSFTATDGTSALLAVDCMRSGALPGPATLQSSGAVEAKAGNTVNVIILVCAALALVTCACLLCVGRASGLAGVWAIVGWIVLFCLLAALIAVSASWFMSTLSMIALVICLIAFLWGLVTLYGAMAPQLKRGRGAYAAYADACKKQLKVLAILYGVLLLIGLVLMIAFQAAAYGVLGRLVAVSALVSFVILFVGLRLVLWSVTQLKAKR